MGDPSATVISISIDEPAFSDLEIDTAVTAREAGIHQKAASFGPCERLFHLEPNAA
jgi:hypothetical protein